MSEPDALEAHRAAAEAFAWERPPVPASWLRACAELSFRETEAQERYLREVDLPAHPEDAGRGERYLEALARTRALADADQPLELAALAELNASLRGLAGPAPFRCGPAFAAGGARRYGLPPGLAAEFAAGLARVEALALHPCARAVRLYLDVIHVHPFADGNARLARLALEHVLRRAGLPTPELAPFVGMPKPPGEARRLGQLTKLLVSGVLRAGGVCRAGLE